MKTKELICLLATASLLQGCAINNPPTIYNAPFPVENIQSGQSLPFWAYPRNLRVSLHKWDNNDFEFTLNDFPSSEAQPHDDDVCWAYCASQVLKYDGVNVSPDELVEKIRERRKGDDLKSDAGTVLDIMRPLLGNGRFVGLYKPDAQSLAKAMTMDSPVILALKPKEEGGSGHAVVLTGIRFSTYMYGPPILPSALTIYDPWTGEVTDYDNEEEFKTLWDRIDWCIYFTDYTHQYSEE